MSYKIIDGDYVTDDGGQLLTVTAEDALVQQAEQLLKAQRGRFYPNKNLGSRLYRGGVPREACALAFAQEALADTDGVFVQSVRCTQGYDIYTLAVNHRGYEVSIKSDI